MNLDTYINIYVPIGVTLPWPSLTFPDSFAICDGSELLKTDYPRLVDRFDRGDGVSMYGETDGAGGAGTTHLKLPDYRDYFIRGTDVLGTLDPDYLTRTDRGDGTAGAVIGSKQSFGFKAHQHTVVWQTNQQNNFNVNATATAIRNFNGTINVATSLQSAGGTETRPDNTSVYFIVRII